MKVRFAWFDMWIGVYVDTEKRRLYVCPLPCLLVEIQLPGKAAISPWKAQRDWDTLKDRRRERP